MPLFVLSLSRLSRDTGKLSRTLEMVLARRVSVVTANYLLREGDVWVRRGQLVTPDNSRPDDALRTMGLAGVHRKVVEGIATHTIRFSRDPANSARLESQRADLIAHRWSAPVTVGADARAPSARPSHARPTFSNYGKRVVVD